MLRGWRLILVQVIHGALRMGSRRENRPFVLSQDLQPRGEVGCAVSFRSGGVIVSLSEGHGAVASFPLGMKPGLGFQGLPQVRIDGAFGHIAVDGHFLIGVLGAEDTRVARRDFSQRVGLPGHIEMMQRHEQVLDARARAQFRRAAEQHPDRPVTDLLTERLFLGNGNRLTDRGDLRAGRPRATSLSMISWYTE